MAPNLNLGFQKFARIYGMIILWGFFSTKILAAPAAPLNLDQELQKLPGKTLSLPFILDQAIKHADSFQKILSLVPASKAPELYASAPLDVFLVGQLAYTKDQKEESSRDLNSLENSKGYSLGLSKLLITGTTLSAQVQSNEALIDAAPFTCGTAFTTLARCELKQAESVITLGVEQSLWKDFFGYSTRKKLHAGELESSALLSQALEASENWSLGIAQAYYQAWLNKQKVITARAKLQRQEDLARVTRLRVNRGASARPELLQIESAALAAKTEEARVSEELNQVWRQLVAIVKLPKPWYEIDPVLVPMVLEDKAPALDQFCGQVQQAIRDERGSQKLETLLQGNSTMDRAQAQAQAAELKLKAQRLEARPDLKVFGQYGANAFDDQMNESFSEARDFNHDFWTVGVKLSMPLGFRANRAQVYQETANQIRLQAEAAGARTDQELDLLKACADLERAQEDGERLKQALQKQTERARLEQERFKTGRVPIFNAISATNDLGDTELLSNQNRAFLHLTYWQIRKLKGDIAQEMKTRFAAND